MQWHAASANVLQVQIAEGQRKLAAMEQSAQQQQLQPKLQQPRIADASAAPPWKRQQQQQQQQQQRQWTDVVVPRWACAVCSMKHPGWHSSCHNCAGSTAAAPPVRQNPSAAAITVAAADTKTEVSAASDAAMDTALDSSLEDLTSAAVITGPEVSELWRRLELPTPKVSSPSSKTELAARRDALVAAVSVAEQEELLTTQLAVPIHEAAVARLQMLRDSLATVLDEIQTAAGKLGGFASFEAADKKRAALVASHTAWIAAGKAKREAL